MTTTLNPNPVSTAQLTWNPDAREYVGEISSTHGFGRVWIDSCDEGLTLVSKRTGEHATFVVCHTERDIDGDVAYWILEAADRSVDVTVRLFND